MSSLKLGFDPYALVHPKSTADAILLLEEGQRTLEQLHADLLQVEKCLVQSRALMAQMDVITKLVSKLPRDGGALASS